MRVYTEASLDEDRAFTFDMYKFGQKEKLKMFYTHTFHAYSTKFDNIFLGLQDMLTDLSAMLSLGFRP